MPFLLAIMGPTASGKSDLAEAIADRTGAVLLNADAFQVYRGLDIGTGKSDRKSEYRLLDLVDPGEPFGLGIWLECAANEVRRLFEEGRSAIVVGGTGLYIRALFEGYDTMHPEPDPEVRSALQSRDLDDLVAELRERAPVIAEATDLRNRVRVTRALERLESEPLPRVVIPSFRRAKIALDWPMDALDRRIQARFERMFELGWEDEVRGLRDRGFSADAPGFRAIGYREVLAMISGEIDLPTAQSQIITATRQYAKRQRTWMRKEPNLVTIELQDGRRAIDDVWPKLDWDFLGANG